MHAGAINSNGRDSDGRVSQNVCAELNRRVELPPDAQRIADKAVEGRPRASRSKASDDSLPTDARLKDVFRAMVCEMTLDKITVSALCERAGISRKTFYARFENIDALLCAIVHDDIVAPSLRLFPPCVSNMSAQVSAPLLNTLCYQGILDHRAFYEHIVSKNRERLFIHALQQSLTECQDVIVDLIGTERTPAQKYASRFLATGQAAIILQWIRDGMTETPQQLGAWFTNWSTPALMTMTGD